MNEQNIDSLPPPKNMFISIAVVQIICVLALLLCFLSAKYVFKDCFSDVKNFVCENIFIHTNVNEIFDGAENEV